MDSKGGKFSCSMPELPTRLDPCLLTLAPTPAAMQGYDPKVMGLQGLTLPNGCVTVCFSSLCH